MEINSWEVIAKLIALTSSVGFLPDYIALGQDKSESIHPSKIELNIPYNLYAAYPLEEELSRNAKLFLETCKTLFQEKVKGT